MHVKIDSLTAPQNCGKFARLCVELDLTKPLDAFVKINDNWYNIEYEGLSEICYLYERYGYKKERCEMKGHPCGVMPGKTNTGKEANPMKDDNGMNKQNNYTVAPEVNDNSGTDSQRALDAYSP